VRPCPTRTRMEAVMYFAGAPVLGNWAEFHVIKGSENVF